MLGEEGGQGGGWAVEKGEGGGGGKNRGVFSQLDYAELGCTILR
jgi:hypothetical protein